MPSKNTALTITEQAIAAIDWGDLGELPFAKKCEALTALLQTKTESPAPTSVRTAPPIALHELRAAAGHTLAYVGQKMRRSVAEVSRIEGVTRESSATDRRDWTVSTLRDYLGALGLDLEIRATRRRDGRQWSVRLPSPVERT